jgi:hypothetical protein
MMAPGTHLGDALCLDSWQAGCYALEAPLVEVCKHVALPSEVHRHTRCCLVVVFTGPSAPTGHQHRRLAWRAGQPVFATAVLVVDAGVPSSGRLEYANVVELRPQLGRSCYLRREGPVLVPLPRFLRTSCTRAAPISKISPV